MNFDQNWRISFPKRNRKSTKLHRVANLKKPILFLPKAENRERNKAESANRNRHQDRKSDVFWYESNKIAETENPNTTLPKVKSLSEMWCETFAVKH